MTKEDRDKLLIYLTEQTNNDVTDCRSRIEMEKGKIEGLQMVAAQIARYVRGQAESEEVMLSEEVKRYRELSGDTNPNTPISRIGGYLDGYEKALEQEPCNVTDINVGDMISRQPKTGQWIPVSERLPEDKQSVLVWCPQYKNIYCAYLEKEQWWIFGAFVQIVPNEVVAWMPLPEMNEFDVCWITGDYDEQECEECPHRHECSGYEGGEDDE